MNCADARTIVARTPRDVSTNDHASLDARETPAGIPSWQERSASRHLAMEKICASAERNDGVSCTISAKQARIMSLF
jgi:hypothetical protein